MTEENVKIEQITMDNIVEFTQNCQDDEKQEKLHSVLAGFLEVCMLHGSQLWVRVNFDTGRFQYQFADAERLDEMDDDHRAAFPLVMRQESSWE